MLSAAVTQRQALAAQQSEMYLEGRYDWIELILLLWCAEGFATQLDFGSCGPQESNHSFGRRSKGHLMEPGCMRTARDSTQLHLIPEGLDTIRSPAYHRRPNVR
jgi:hypothetical protein